MKIKIQTEIVLIAMVGMLAGCGEFQANDSESSDQASLTITTISPYNDVDAPVVGKACTILPDPGKTALQRLNRTEYKNSMKDLFSLSSVPTVTLPEDGQVDGFNNNAESLHFDTDIFPLYYDAAETVITQAFTENKAAVMICAETTSACTARILQNIGDRAYHRPMKQDEIDAAVKVATDAASRGEIREMQLKIALQAILVSPNFLFKAIFNSNPDNATSVANLSDYELATRLSYFLWSSLPDTELLAAAKAGRLQDLSELRSQTLRMLKSVKASALVENFAAQWLRLKDLAFVSPDPATYPTFNDQVKADMATETKMFFANILNVDLPATELMTARYSFLNSGLAKIYHLSGVSGSSFVKADLSPLGTDRKGLLTQPGILALNADPKEASIVRRGKWVLENLLCDMPPPPPQDFMLPGGELTKSAARLENKACAGCHMSMDNLGKGLFGFNPIGEVRKTDSTGVAISTLGQLPSGQVFNTPGELADVIAKDPRYRACLARKMTTYALAREVRNYNLCEVYSVAETTVDENKPLSELILGVVQSNMFRKQRGGQL